MKRYLCLALCFLMFFTVGCSGDKNPSSDGSGSSEGIVDTVSKGKLGDIKYPLGADVTEVKEYYGKLAADYEQQMMQQEQEESAHNHADGHEDDGPYYEEISHSGYTEIDIADAHFYYEDEKADGGIAVISTDCEVLGFTPGFTTKYEIEDAINQTGTTLNITEAEKVFLAYDAEDVIILRYEFEDYRLDFYFYDNTLMNTVLMDTAKWGV